MTAVVLGPGDVIPGTAYRLDGWLGGGAAGVVYEAIAIGEDRRVAVKVFREELSRCYDCATRWRDDATRAGGTGSTTIVAPIDFGELPDGRHWIATEVVHGTGLRQVLGEPMAPTRAIGILRQLCKGLAAAHAAGVVHLDFKPGNIILTRVDDRDDVAKITDFGSAAMAPETVGDPRDRVHDPRYLAPEQIVGLPSDGRLDQYAFGCVAYEMLTGQAPFTGETTVVLAQHLDTVPAALADTPAGLAAVIMRCLAKQPADRYDDMDAVEAALCEAQIDLGVPTTFDDLPVPAAPDERRKRILEGLRALPPARAPWWKRPWLVGVGVAAVLLVAIGVSLRPSPKELTAGLPIWPSGSLAPTRATSSSEPTPEITYAAQGPAADPECPPEH